MIRNLVDFALTHRLFVLAFALLLFTTGIGAFHNLPIEAYPDVADNYVDVITQWSGISAEQVEQQGNDSARNCNERHSTRHASPLVFSVRAFGSETHL